MKFLVELRVNRTTFQPYGAIREFEPKPTPQHRVFDNAWRWGEVGSCNHPVQASASFIAVIVAVLFIFKLNPLFTHISC